MLDRWTRPGDAAKMQPARALLRPGDPEWRQRWLAAVRRRMAATPQRQARMFQDRLAAMASDAPLWGDIRAAEVAYARGDGEWLTPDEPLAGDRGHHGRSR
jgi:hypothetical protein